MKILEVLSRIVGELLETWEDWLPHIAASIYCSVCESTRQSPHFIFGGDKRLPYDLLSSSRTRVNNVECQIKVFPEIHKSVKDKLRPTSTAMCNQQYKRASAVSLEVSDSVMIRVTERNANSSPKLVEQRLLNQHLGEHILEIWDLYSRSSEIVHADRLKRTSAVSEEGEPPLVETSETATALGLLELVLILITSDLDDNCTFLSGSRNATPCLVFWGPLWLLTLHI